MECVFRNYKLCTMIKVDLWRWRSVYPGTRYSVSWSGMISGGYGVCIMELDTLYHDSGVFYWGDRVYIQELENLYHDQGVLCRWQSVYPGTRHSVSWSGVFKWRWWSVDPGSGYSVSWSGVISGGDGVCIQDQDTLYHDQGWCLEVMECVSRIRILCIMIRGDLRRWWSMYPRTRNTASWSGVISEGDGVCIQKLGTLYHDQGWSLEVMEVSYPGTRHYVSWSGVMSGGDGVCIQELGTL